MGNANEQSGEVKAVTLDRGTLVPLGVVGSVLLVLAAAFGFFNSSFEKMDLRFDAIDGAQEKLDRRMEKLEEKSGERWSATDQKLWVSEFRRLNPSMDIPTAE